MKLTYIRLVLILKCVNKRQLVVLRLSSLTDYETSTNETCSKCQICKHVLIYCLSENRKIR